MVSIKTYHNVLISPYGDVFDLEGNLIHTPRSSKPYKIDVTQIDIQQTLPGVYYDCIHRFGMHVWGHFREIVARFYYYRHEISKHDYVLISRAHRIKPQEHVDHFNTFGVDYEMLVCVSKVDNTYYYISTLKTIDWIPLHNNTDVISFIRNTWLDRKQPVKSRPIKLYLRRDGGRGIKNDHVIDDLLLDRGFTFFTGEEGFDQHVDMFFNAETIIGPHGAAFFNTLFCEPDTNIKEFVPITRRVDMWMNQSYSLGNQNHELIEVDCSQDYNLNLPVRLLSKYID